MYVVKLKKRFEFQIEKYQLFKYFITILKSSDINREFNKHNLSSGERTKQKK